MGMALLSAQRSKDPSTKVGACIVDDDHKVVSNGYNGMPTGIDEKKISWNTGKTEKRNGYAHTRYAFGCYIRARRRGLRNGRKYIYVLPKRRGNRMTA